MVFLGLKPGAAEWKAKTNPLSYGGTHYYYLFFITYCLFSEIDTGLIVTVVV